MIKSKTLSAIALLAASGVWQLFAYDSNDDGMSDVFADHYGLAQNSAELDEDGDGFTNFEESKWGTHPSESTTAFTRIEVYPSQVFLFSFDSVEGKRYQIEFSDDLLSWTGLGNIQQGNGNAVTFGTQTVGSPGFWRLSYRGDVDFDGDGLSLFDENLLLTDDRMQDTDGDFILDVNEYLAGTQPNVVDAPPAITFEPISGDYATAQSIELVNVGLPNYIYYTTDGSEPTLFSQKYTAPIPSGDDAILNFRAKVILPNGVKGAESSATYRVGTYTDLPQKVYYGWVTASAELGYAYNTSELTEVNNIYAPENYLVMSDGWIINGEFQPDISAPAQEIFFGLTKTFVDGIFRDILGYSVDSSVFYNPSSVAFKNFRTMGTGWLKGHDEMEADLDVTAQMIYYSSVALATRSGSQYSTRFWLHTTDSKDQFGNSFYTFPIGEGWVTSKDTMQPDTTVGSSQVRYGLVSSYDGTYSRIYTNKASDLYSNFVTFNSVRLGKGWGMGAAGMIPDRSEPPMPIYYGEKAYSNGDLERIYSPYESDIFSPRSPVLYPYRKYISVGPGYSLDADRYELSWVAMPQDVYRGTDNIYPSSLPHLPNLLSYDTSKLQGFPVPVLLGLGWIENNTFIEYIDDDDGLSLADELANGTNPNYFDTDGDLLPDGFEVASIHLDPLVANPLRGEDFDGDGLDSYLELINGADPDNEDTDGDFVLDGDEVAYGTDPNAINIKPFNPYDFVGSPINDANCLPLGDVGVIPASGGGDSGYSVSGTVGDPSDSESERWKLKFRGRSIESEQFGVVDSFDLNLHGGSVFEIKLEHVATNLGDTPDYDYEATLTDFQGFLLSDLDGLLGTGGDVDIATVEGYSAYLAPLKSVSFSSSFSGSDAVGPRYRKVALNGRPLPDEKPEQESETEQHAEETYIDAFDLRLNHDTTYLYTPLAASDLVLQVIASANESSWSDRGGLKPHEELTSPFGAAWSSNLAAYVEAVQTLGDVIVDPISINVVDEAGRSQRFGTNNMLTFFPWPSSRVDKKTWLNTLEGFDTDSDGTVDRLIYTKKYGTQLTYDLCDAWFMYSTDRIDGSNEVKKHNYWRLMQVEDRYGNDLVYDYGTSQYSLIPAVISSTSHPDQFIAIDRSANCRRVESVTDSRGHTITFNYQDVLVFDSTLTQLKSVDYPDGTTKEYSYETALDIQNDGGRLTNHFHANIKQIKDKSGNAHTFQYGFDRTKTYLSTGGGRLTFAVNINYLPDAVEDHLNAQLAAIPQQSGTAEYQMMYGLPRQVTSVTLPSGIGSTTFAKVPSTMTQYGTNFAAASGTTVTDAEGNETVYTFGGLAGEIVDVDNSGDSLSTEWMIYYTQMQVHHGALEGEAGHLGKETFNFDLASGLALSSMTDFSGNTTSWLFEEAMPPGRVLPELAGVSSFMTKWADPTQKIDALGRIETYQYDGDTRIMSEINDVHGTVTSYSVDSMGRRDSKTVTDAAGLKLLEETYTYADQDIDPLTTHPGFMVEKRVVAFANHSAQAWEQDLVTRYVPDSRGRLQKEITNPGGLALTTEYSYDLNNNRLSVTDPRSNETTFTYDKLNRLVQVTNPIAGTSIDAVSGEPVESTTTQRFLFDPRGNLACEIDENGHITLNFFDALGRKTISVRDMDGLGLPAIPITTEPQIVTLDEAIHITAADITTRYSYNAVNSLETVTDPRGTVSKNEYDALQRLRHSYTHHETGDTPAILQNSFEKTHTEFVYEIAKNTGASGFTTEGFKPTKIIRHDAVRGAEGTSGLWTLEQQFTYDAEYRQTQSKTEYKPGSFRITGTAYGSITSGKETLVSTITDARGKITRSTRDGLGRQTLAQDAFATPDQISTQMFYASTGLAWRTIDPNGNHSETNFDLAGRAIKTWQPDPATGLVDLANSPSIETIYDLASNVEATINPLGQRWDFEYDARNRQNKVIAPAVVDAESTLLTPIRPISKTFFDGLGNVIKTIDPRGAEMVTQYDRANRPVQATTPAVPIYGEANDIQLTSTTSYDKNSNLTKVIDFEGNQTVNFYDKLNRLKATATNPVTGQPSETEGSPNSGDIIVANEFDDAGNQVKVIDGAGAVTGFRYDGLSRNTQTIWDEGADLERTKTLTYDALVLTQRTDEKGQVTQYLYDDLHRLEDVINVGRAIDNRHYTFDDNGSILTVTHPNEANTLRDTASTFDALNRVTSETSADVAHSYQYDKAGNRLTTTYGNTARQLVSTYDAHNRLKTLTEGSRVTVYAYNPNGAIVKKTLPNNVIVECIFDQLGRKQTSTNTAGGAAQPFAQYLFSHDKQGNLREIDESYPLGNLTDRIVFNTYDATYRLKNESISTASSTTETAYQYDDGNNRTQKSVTVGSGTAAVTSYAYGDGSTASTANSNQLVSFTKPDQSVVSFTYDLNGNRATRTENSQIDTFSYDYENRLLSFNKLNGADAGNHTWEYDYRTRRVQFDKASGTSTTNFSFSGGTSAQEYTTSTTTPEVEFIRGSDYGGGIGGILYTLRGGVPSIKHYNSRGDVVAATNDSGALTWQSQYEAFGAITNESGSTPDRHKSNTKAQDLHNYANEGFRWRDLETGMFFQRDPLGFVDGPNVYTYVVQNPWTYFDPLGLYSWKEYKQDFGRGLEVIGETGGNFSSGFNRQPDNIVGVGGYQGAPGSAEKLGEIARDFVNVGSLTSGGARVSGAPKGGTGLGAQRLAPVGTVDGLALAAAGAAKVPLAGITAAVLNSQNNAEHKPEQTAKPDYTKIPNPKNIDANTKPTPRQVREMKKLNEQVNRGTLKDDVTGEPMVPSAKSQRGVTPPPNEVQVDHIVPVSKGGNRNMNNLELRTRANNRAKSNNIEEVKVNNE